MGVVCITSDSLISCSASDITSAGASEPELPWNSVFVKGKEPALIYFLHFSNSAGGEYRLTVWLDNFHAVQPSLLLSSFRKFVLCEKSRGGGRCTNHLGFSEVESVDLVSEEEGEEVVSTPLPYVNLIEGTRAALNQPFPYPFSLADTLTYKGRLSDVPRPLPLSTLQDSNLSNVRESMLISSD